MQSRLTLLIILLFTVTGAFAQHLIVKKNGDRIYCRIVGDDSTYIYYTKPAQKSTFQVNKTEVEKYSTRSQSNAVAAPGAPRPQNELLIISISAGQASPRGDFESQDLYSNTSGLAKRGFTAKGGLILKIAKNVGLSAAYRYQSNPFNNALFTSQLNASYPGVTFTASSGSWKVRGAYGGLYFTFPVSRIEGFSIDFDVSAGFPKCSYPELTIKANQGGRYSTFSSYSNDVHAIAITGGIGFKYSLHKNVGITFNVNYLHTRPEFSNNYTSQFNGQFAYSDYTQKINTLNVQAGLSFFIFQKEK